jgi:hypothetical protein
VRSKSRPLVNPDPCLLTNCGSEVFFRCQVSGVRFQVSGGVVKIAMYTDGILIPFLFHIFYMLRFQVSGVRNDEHRR